MGDIYQEIIELKARGECAALATVISTSGSTPRSQGAKMLIRENKSIVGTIGGSVLEEKVREEAMDVIRKQQPRIISFDLTGEGGMICGGKTEVYIEPIIPKPVLFLFGGGHISFALAGMGKMIDFKVIIIDDREEYANPARFPAADQTIAGDYVGTFSKISVDQSSFIVIVTRGHAFDQTILEWAVTTDAKYIGMIGSKSKIKTIYDNLIAKGVRAEVLTRVHAPIGLAIDAETPEEIAVSIVAEIIKVYRSGKPRKSSTCPV